MHPKRKLSEDQVREIRRSPSPQARLAAQYGVDRRAIKNVLSGLTYRDVPDWEPAKSDDAHRFDNKYVIGDPLKLLYQISTDYAPTILTAPAIPSSSPDMGWAGIGDRDSSDHIEQQRAIIRECLRIAGPFGIVMYVHRPRTGPDDMIDLGHGIVRGFPLRRLIVWSWPPGDVRNPACRRGLLRPHNFAHIYIFTEPKWEPPKAPKSRLYDRGAVWNNPRPHPENDPPILPLVLAQQCVALGWGRVLDPCAGSGTTALAAIKARRNWTLLGSSECDRAAFKKRQAGCGEEDPHRGSPYQLGSRQRAVEPR